MVISRSAPPPQGNLEGPMAGREVFVCQGMNSATSTCQVLAVELFATVPWVGLSTHPSPPRATQAADHSPGLHVEHRARDRSHDPDTKVSAPREGPGGGFWPSGRCGEAEVGAPSPSRVTRCPIRSGRRSSRGGLPRSEGKRSVPRGSPTGAAFPGCRGRHLRSLGRDPDPHP